MRRRTPAGYSGTPLPKKLGIKPGSDVALLGAPRGFVEGTLGPLPEGATLREDLRAPFDVGLLFVDSKADARQALCGGARGRWASRARSGSAGRSRPRASRPTSTATWSASSALSAGLVDYKVAAVDATWSGLCFARRRK